MSYEPRAAFMPLHERDNRWSVIVAHRRAGKTVSCINDLLTQALSTTKENARYAYIAPYYSQAKQIAWDYLKRYGRAVATKVSESELSIDLINGARIRLFGADNADALRGMYLDGVVLDEYGDMRPSVWGEVIRPLLTDRKGWAVFIGTPKGRNHFYDIWQSADESWFKLKLKASESGLLDPAELEDAKQTMTQDQFQQEFECSFEAAVMGAIFANELQVARNEKRIANVPYEPLIPVHTAWDLGVADATSIWFWQQVGREVRVIDYYEATGEGLPHFVKMLQAKPYIYGQHFAPHDIAVREFATGMARIDVARDLGINFLTVPRQSLEDGVHGARLFMARCWFDENKCREGLDGLANYRREYDEKRGVFRTAPVHDWASHACLDGETLIATDGGMVKIKDVSIGDWVHTPAGLAMVTNAGPTKVASKLIEITTENGRTILATPEHKVFTTRGVLTANELRYDDSIHTMESAPCFSLANIESMGYRDAVIESFSANGIGIGKLGTCTSTKSAASSDYFTVKSTSISTEEVARAMLSLLTEISPTLALTTGSFSSQFEIESTPYKSLVGSGFTESLRAITKQTTRSMAAHSCTDMSGSITTARFQTATTFITRMATRLTTTLQTLSCLVRQSMQDIMQKIISGLVAMKTFVSLSQSVTRPNRGTQAKKASNGMSSTGRMYFRISQGLSDNAMSAVRPISRHIQRDQSSATRIVKLRRLEGAEATRLVYDLTVEHHHCYLANGLLVSNSDSFRYMSLCTIQQKSEPIRRKLSVI